MSQVRCFGLALCLMSFSGVGLVAQASTDSTSRAVAAHERALSGRTIARRTVAILPFEITSPDPTLAALGYGLAEFLSDDLAHSHRLTMVERVRIGDLQRESNLQLAGNIDPATSVRAGRLLAAQSMIVGVIHAPAVGALTIEERGVDVMTGAIEMHHTASTPIDGIFRAERDLVMRTFSTFGIILTPDEKRLLYERVAPVFRAFLAFSRGVQAEQQGSDDLAVSSFQEATALDRTFKLAATKLSAARLRIAMRMGSPAAVSSVKEELAGKDLGNDPGKSSVKDAVKEIMTNAAAGKESRPSAGSPVAGSAPGGAPSSSPSGAKPDATPMSSKPEASPSTRKATQTTHKRPHPKPASPRA